MSLKAVIFIVILVIILILILKFFLNSNKERPEENTIADPNSISSKDEEEKRIENDSVKRINEENDVKKNDKIIIVEGASYLNIKKAVQQFYDSYKKGGSDDPVIRIFQFQEDKTVITFPENIDFFTLCSLVNYLYYPQDIFYSADIKGWSTIKSNDNITEPEIVNKYVMLFIPFDDNEYDNIFITTEDNKAYKLSFSNGGLTKLNSPSLHFVENKFTIEESEYKVSEEIQ